MTRETPGPLHTIAVGAAGPRVAFLHGLFGQGRNWNHIAKGLAGPPEPGGGSGADDRGHPVLATGSARAGARCLLVDLPDHGRSPWSPGGFSFEAYAASVAATLRSAAPGERWTVVGHSLGGKTAMVLALTEPQLVDRLCVVDIAPKSYGDLHRFGGYIAEMRRLPLGELVSRADAQARFVEDDPAVKAFLLQNLRREGATWRWAVNLEMIAADAARGADSSIAGFPASLGARPAYEGLVLWLNGADSEYVGPSDAGTMRRYFPRVRTVTVKGAGHWVHTDAPGIVIGALRRFLAAQDR